MKSNRRVRSIHYFVAFTGFGSFSNNVRHIRAHWRHIDPGYRRRAALSAGLHMLTAAAGLPFRLAEQVAYGRQLEATRFHAAPIFIIGHWRSGTTYLHNLMCRDQNFGYVSLFQTMANDLAILGDRAIKPIAQQWIPQFRPTDNVEFTMDQPQEEEHAMVRLSPYSFYHMCCFPRQAREYFDRYVMFGNSDDDEAAAWRRQYIAVLKKAYVAMDERRLLLKNPVNTARIPQLLDMFPDAKFIHIYRNPYDVFMSTRNQYFKTLDITRLQNVSDAEIEDNILHFYRKMMQHYVEDRKRIPAGNLIEIKFEDFEASPIAQLERIYRLLGLPHFAAARSEFADYVAGSANYCKNRYKLSERTIEKVNTAWSFAFDQWGYRRAGDTTAVEGPAPRSKPQPQRDSDPQANTGNTSYTEPRLVTMSECGA